MRRFPTQAEFEEAPANSGRRLGRYLLQTKIAAGGMANVYSARIVGTNPTGDSVSYVIKQLREEFQDKPEYVRMFCEEARLAVVLDHPHVVRTYDSCLQPGAYYLVMEHLQGIDLEELRDILAARQRRLPWAMTLATISAIAEALHYVHTKKSFDGSPLGIVHRDISPQNIVLCEDGGVKLVDFGIAKSVFHSDQTEAGSLKGKLSYMSPEQCRAETLDGRSDIFSLGTLLYEMATTRHPFADLQGYQLLNAIVKTDPPSADTVAALPTGLGEIISRCMEREPQKRYQTAAHLCVDIERLMAAHHYRWSREDFAAYVSELEGPATFEGEDTIDEPAANEEPDGPLYDDAAQVTRLDPAPRAWSEAIESSAEEEQAESPTKEAVDTTLNEIGLATVTGAEHSIAPKRSAIPYLGLLAAGVLFALFVQYQAGAGEETKAGLGEQRKTAVKERAAGSVHVIGAKGAVWLLAGRTPLDIMPVHAAREHRVRIKWPARIARPGLDAERESQWQDYELGPSFWERGDDGLLVAKRHVLREDKPELEDEMTATTTRPLRLQVTSEPSSAQVWIYVGGPGEEIRIGDLELGVDAYLRVDSPEGVIEYRVSRADFNAEGVAELSLGGTAPLD